MNCPFNLKMRCLIPLDLTKSVNLFSTTHSLIFLLIFYKNFLSTGAYSAKEMQLRRSWLTVSEKSTSLLRINTSFGEGREKLLSEPIRSSVVTFFLIKFLNLNILWKVNYLVRAKRIMTMTSCWLPTN